MRQSQANNILFDFIASERHEYQAKDSNLFAFSLQQAERYYGFLLIIIARYKRTSHKASSIFLQVQRSFSGKSGVVSALQSDFIDQHNQSSLLVQLEIESFFLFAKILLDKIAFFMRDYFGEPKGISLISHHLLVKNFSRFRTEKGLSFPEGFSENIQHLQKHINDFRDDAIVHKTKPRTVRGVSYDGTLARLISSQIYPTENEIMNDHTTLSPPLLELKKSLDLYIKQLMVVIKTNRPKSRFRISE